jgi:cytochrome c-type biogenesis protein CcmH/NrfG
MVTLIAVALVFGVHSAVDWTWFVPANAVTGLLAAGWVAARPPLRTRLEAAALAGAVPVVAAARAPRDSGPLWAPPVEEPPAAADVAGPGALPVAEAEWRRRREVPWGAVAGAVIVLALALTAGWATYQPVRSVHAGDIAIQRLEQNQLDAAVSVAEIARKRNPLSPEPLWELGYIEEQRGRLANAERALEDAVKVQPANAESWRRLGRFQLSTLNQADKAVHSFRAAYFLDPRNPSSTSDFLEASRAAASP